MSAPPTISRAVIPLSSANDVPAVARPRDGSVAVRHSHAESSRTILRVHQIGSNEWKLERVRA
jgi:hypothetical protein